VLSDTLSSFHSIR